MIKREITYTDYDGVERKETFYFNLTKAELLKMESSEDGGLSNKLQNLIDSPNGREIMHFVNAILLAAYGEKSADGRRFVKSPEISKAFSETPAFDEIFTELVTDAEKAAVFVNGLMPDLTEIKKSGNASSITVK